MTEIPGADDALNFDEADTAGWYLYCETVPCDLQDEASLTDLSDSVDSDRSDEGGFATGADDCAVNSKGYRVAFSLRSIRSLWGFDLIGWLLNVSIYW